MRMPAAFFAEIPWQDAQGEMATQLVPKSSAIGRHQSGSVPGCSGFGLSTQKLQYLKLLPIQSRLTSFSRYCAEEFGFVLDRLMLLLFSLLFAYPVLRVALGYAGNQQRLVAMGCTHCFVGPSRFSISLCERAMPTTGSCPPALVSLGATLCWPALVTARVLIALLHLESAGSTIAPKTRKRRRAQGSLTLLAINRCPRYRLEIFSLSHDQLGLQTCRLLRWGEELTHSCPQRSGFR